MVDESAIPGGNSVVFSGGATYLAIEVRSDRFGFALFQGTALADWGVRLFSGRTATRTARKIFQNLLQAHAPSTVVMRDVRRARHASSQKARRILAIIRAELEVLGIPLIVLEPKRVAAYFAGTAKRTKWNIAQLIASLFEELRLRVPENRKPWVREAYFMAMFDAVATGLAWSGGVTEPQQA
ncbi:MAG: hypothetical protein LAO79_16425 [Acidobacteriia bacterium]|nr:hypothetical protein [Terriglobia bacterium]